MLINFYFHLRLNLLLGSSTLYGFGATHIFISRKLCYTMCLAHLRTLLSLSFFFLWPAAPPIHYLLSLSFLVSGDASFFFFLFFLFPLRLRLYIIFCSCLLLSLAMHSSFYLRVVFLLILRLPEQIASSCSSTCNTCNTAE